MSAAAFVVGLSLLAHDYTRYAYWVHRAALRAASALCLALAGSILILPGWREVVVRHLDRLSGAPWKRHAAWLLATYAGIYIWYGFVRYCQYRGFQLTQDTAFSIHLAHNFLRHGTLADTLSGAHALSIHFTLFMPILSPVLLLWDNPLALLAAYHMLMASTPIAAYLIAFRLTRSSLAGFACMLLTLAMPTFQGLVFANMHVAVMAPIFLWGMLFFHMKRWWLFAFSMLLFVSCHESAPFPLIGLGFFYTATERRWKNPRGWAIGLGITAAAIAIFFLQLRTIQHLESLEPNPIGTLPRTGLFAHLAGDGVPQEEVLHDIFTHPLRTASHLFSSRHVYYPVLRLLLTVCFLPLLTLAQLPFWTAVLPQLLANPGAPASFLSFEASGYALFASNNASYVFGPLLWATAHGVRLVMGWAKAPGRRGLLMLVVLLCAGFGYRYSSPSLIPGWTTDWFDAAPKVLPDIPKEARVWALDLLSPSLSDRRWIRVIENGPDVPYHLGYQRLFKPDYVLISREWVHIAKPPYRDRMLTFWNLHGYRIASEEAGVLLLRHPEPSATPQRVPQWIGLPAPDPAAAVEFAHYLLAEDGTRVQQ
ncbi:MAG: DUF2079 domain-containing protein [Elusimicrobiota bacterium]